MRTIKLLMVLAPLALVACDSTEPARPSSIALQGGTTSAQAGVALTQAFTFAVLDQHGKPMSGVPITISVTGGGGVLAGAPTVSASGQSSVGTWTLGAQAGPNELTLAVEGISPKKVTVTGVAGPPARLSAITSASISGVVDTQVQPAPRALLTDAFDNPVAGVTVGVTVSHGTATPVVTSAADGTVAVASWKLGTVSGTQSLVMTAGAATITFTADALPGPLSALSVASGANQFAFAGTPLSGPIDILAADAFGNGIPDLPIAFQVLSGGGVLSEATALTAANGRALVPSWTLGLTVVPQAIRATSGSHSVDVSATVTTDFSIDVRFFGAPISESRRALLTDAARRISAVVVGDLLPVQALDLSVDPCGVTGVAPLSEIIDDLVIYAAIQPIDGPGKILASAGPCYIRTAGLPVIGIMMFDIEDIGFMETNGIFGDVILHEMMHVLGFGIGLYWDPFLTGKDTPNVAYHGQHAQFGCANSGGSVTCTNGVPVENTGGAGTFNSHWRESVFDHELMTGYADVSAMPLSLTTIGSLEDIGYAVNPSAADPYFVPASTLRMAAPALLHEGWESLDPPILQLPTSSGISSPPQVPASPVRIR